MEKGEELSKWEEANFMRGIVRKAHGRRAWRTLFRVVVVFARIANAGNARVVTAIQIDVNVRINNFIIALTRASAYDPSRLFFRLLFEQEREKKEDTSATVRRGTARRGAEMKRVDVARISRRMRSKRKALSPIQTECA